MMDYIRSIKIDFQHPYRNQSLVAATLEAQVPDHVTLNTKHWRELISWVKQICPATRLIHVEVDAFNRNERPDYHFRFDPTDNEWKILNTRWDKTFGRWWEATTDEDSLGHIGESGR